MSRPVVLYIMTGSVSITSTIIRVGEEKAMQGKWNGPFRKEDQERVWKAVSNGTSPLLLIGKLTPMQSWICRTVWVGDTPPLSGYAYDLVVNDFSALGAAGAVKHIVSFGISVSTEGAVVKPKEKEQKKQKTEKSGFIDVDFGKTVTTPVLQVKAPNPSKGEKKKPKEKSPKPPVIVESDSGSFNALMSNAVKAKDYSFIDQRRYGGKSLDKKLRKWVQEVTDPSERGRRIQIANTVGAKHGLVNN